MPLTQRQRRRRFIESHMNPLEASILEIGALNTPTFRRDEADAYIADWIGQEQLIENYPHKENICPVDFVLDGPDFASSISRKFDLLVANHVIEHIPDVITWFQQLAAIATPSARLALAIPDRRYTFDIARTETNTAQLLDCYVNRLERPSFAHIFSHLFYYKKVKAKQIWSGKPLPQMAVRRFTPDIAYARALSMMDAYHSVHCHVFTSSSFLQVFEEIAEIGLIPWHLEAIEEAEPDTNEFLTIFRLASPPARWEHRHGATREASKEEAGPNKGRGDGSLGDGLAALKLNLRRRLRVRTRLRQWRRHVRTLLSGSVAVAGDVEAGATTPPAREAPHSDAPRKYRFAKRDRIRLQIASPFLSGHGAEIGPGSYPSLLPPGVECDYFDKRTPEEMQRHLAGTGLSPERMHAMSEASDVFPHGADFILAHNVLEHIVDPIGALRAWHRSVKDGGVMVVSVPQAGYGPDKRRLPVSLEHLLLDHLLERDGTDFDSREHVFAGMSGFDKGAFRGVDKIAQAQTAFEMATAKSIAERDIHWHVHVFEPKTFLQLAHVAASFEGCRIELLQLSSPTHESEALRNKGEIILVYRLHRDAEGVAKDLEPDINGLLEKLSVALKRLETIRP